MAERFVCTKENPWTPDKGRAQHPDAEYLGDSDLGDYSEAEYKCPNCELLFAVELPQ